MEEGGGDGSVLQVSFYGLSIFLGGMLEFSK
jgi:hypothetical protein